MNKSASSFHLLLLISLVACKGGGGGSAQQGANSSANDNSFFEAATTVQALSSLPSCDSSRDGKIYFLSDSSEFKGCANGSWSTLNLTGPQGPIGATGATGPAGATGPQGTTGATGPAGATGATGTTGATGPVGPGGQDGFYIPPVRFTSSTILNSASLSSKDTLCSTEFGSNFETAHPGELPFYLVSSSSSTNYFNSSLSGTYYAFGSNGNSQGIQNITEISNTGSYKLACILKTAPFRVTRSSILSNSSDTVKDSLCSSSFGSSYKAMTRLELSYHKQIYNRQYISVKGENFGLWMSYENIGANYIQYYFSSTDPTPVSSTVGCLR